MARALVGGLLGGGDENGVKRVNGSIGQRFRIVTRKELPLQPQREAPRVNAGTFSEVARAKHPQHMKQRDCLRKETQQRGLGVSLGAKESNQTSSLLLCEGSCTAVSVHLGGSSGERPIAEVKRRQGDIRSTLGEITRLKPPAHALSLHPP